MLCVYSFIYINGYLEVYFSCISIEHTYMDLPNIFTGGHFMYIVCTYTSTYISNIYECTFHVYSLNILSWICQIHLLPNIVCIYFHVHFKISMNVLFIYIQWTFFHGSVKYICCQILYVYTSTYEKISMNVLFMYIQWTFFHGSVKYICCQILYVYISTYISKYSLMYSRWTYFHGCVKYIFPQAL